MIPLMVVVLAAAPDAGARDPAMHVVVMKAFGHDYYLDEVLRPKDLAGQHLDGKRWSPVLVKQLGDALLSELFHRMRVAYAKEHGLEPSKAELERCLAGFKRAGMYPDGLPVELKKATEEMARNMVLSFKVDNALLKELGGRLVVDHMGTIYAIDAQQKLLKRYEAAKVIVFPRDEVREATFTWFGRTFGEITEKDTAARADFSSKPRCETFEAFDGGDDFP